MKRQGNLYHKIISIENLQLADKKAQRGKKYQTGIITHNKQKEQNIQRLHENLKNGTYKTSEYSVFTIFEPKERTISRLEYYPNRIVHHAIMNILEPIFTKSFIAQTYSCIKGRGIHKCLNDLFVALKQDTNNKYCLKLDIEKFYPSVDATILKDRLCVKIKDKQLLNLLGEIIDSNKKGLPLGNYLSQWLANFYLNQFDHWLKEVKKVKHYFRYCDDLVILHHDKAYLHKLRAEIQQYLSVNLKLTLSNYQVFPVNARGIDFVGYVSYPTHILLRKSIKQRWKRMLNKYPNKKSKASYNGWLLHCNSTNLRNKYQV